MAQTPRSSATPYCTVEQALAYHDVRQWADLCSDEGTRGNAGTLADANAADGKRMLQLLMSASGEVEERCFRGERYKPEDLQALTGVSAARLQEIVANLAFWRACKRRWGAKARRSDVPGAVDAEEALEKLGDGEAVFGLVETQAAGNSEVTTLDPGDDRQLVRAARRFFGERACRDRGRD